jgi:hypothetical protein
MITERNSPASDLTDKRNALGIEEAPNGTVHVVAEIIEYLPHTSIGKPRI